MVKRMKKHKATGPDGIPMEFFKWLDEKALRVVLGLINHWWNTGTFRADKLQAEVASIYKKGDPKSQSIYRPISKLPSIYKLYTPLLQIRLADAIDADILETQYGFRRKRSTSILLACVRRILDMAEASQKPIFVTFLDWEKAFDRVEQRKLFESLERMCVGPTYVAAIKLLYDIPQFRIAIGQNKSTWRTQQMGIRQGCPLSLRIFSLYL